MAFGLGGGSMDDKDLIDKLYLLEKHDFIELSNEEIVEVIVRECKYNLFSIKRGLWFDEDMGIHEFVKTTANKLREEHLNIMDILKYRA